MKTITAKDLAAKLHNRQYGNEITKEERLLAKLNNLVVIFGASDDLIEIYGRFEDEIGAYGGGSFFIHPRNGILPEDHECQCNYCNFEAYKNGSIKVDAVWCSEDKGYAWTYKTEVEHECFDILEEDEKYCRGIVIDLNKV